MSPLTAAAIAVPMILAGYILLTFTLYHHAGRYFQRAAWMFMAGDDVLGQAADDRGRELQHYADLLRNPIRRNR